MPLRALAIITSIIIGLTTGSCTQRQEVTSSDVQDSTKIKAEEGGPKTKIERFLDRHGAVIIKSYKDIGTIAGKYGSSGTVRVIEYIDAATGVKENGVKIELKENLRFQKEHASYIDGDELDSLIKGIEYIRAFDPNKARYGSYEAQYRTRGDFEIVVFNDSKGQVAAGIASGLPIGVQLFCELTGLDRFKNTIEDAKKMIAAAGKSGG